MTKYCEHENCKKRAYFGKPRTKSAEFCVNHKPNDYIDVAHKKCKKCKAQPSYGKSGSRLREFCVNHKPDDYIDVTHKKCEHEKCGAQPVFGKPRSKLAEFCVNHKPNDYIDVKNKKCSFDNCTKQHPSYGYIGYSPDRCADHKEEKMIKNPLKRCSECKKIAEFSYENKYYCVICNPDETLDEFITKCDICDVKINIKQKYCEQCKICLKEGKTIKRKLKELAIKNLLDENKIEYKHDKRISEGCSMKRPDFLINTNYGVIVLEIDEFQHNRKNYPPECEIIRMRQIYFDIGCEKCIFIRYNPDKYKSSYGKILTQTNREEYLLNLINKLQDEIPKNPFEIYYLFYDGFNFIDNQPEILDPYKSIYIK